MTVGILHPGAMGAAVGAALRARSTPVRWASDGRNRSTVERAAAAGLDDAGDLAALAAGCDVILSVCPPHAAVEVAGEVAALEYGGVYVDANAVAPRTSLEVGRLVEGAGGKFVDGGIIGGPPRTPGTTRLYLSGPDAPAVAALFDGTVLGAVIVDGPPGAASTLKMAYAAWTKGSAALLLAVRALARQGEVEDGLLAEWALSQPDLAGRSELGAAATAGKAWRFVGEMHEIGDTFAAAGLPDGFARAAAAVYDRLAGYRDAPEDPPADEVIGALLGRGPGR